MIKDFSIIGFGEFFRIEEVKQLKKEEEKQYYVSLLWILAKKLLFSAFFGVCFGVFSLVFAIFAKLSYNIFLWL